MMVLRKLEETDAPFMLEWMHDENVNMGFYADFSSKTLADCISFIEFSKHDEKNAHLAVTDDRNHYMGTVSLKNIDKESGSAEFAIAMRSCAMGTGLASCAMHEIMTVAKEEYHLHNVYWNVKKTNARAIRFYQKNEYLQVSVDAIPEIGRLHAQHMEDLIWFKNEL